MPTTLTRHIGEQLRWEQLVALVGEESIHPPLGDQVAAPGGRVQLVIGWVACGDTCRAVCPLAAYSANYRIDVASTIGRITPL